MGVTRPGTEQSEHSKLGFFLSLHDSARKVAKLRYPNARLPLQNADKLVIGGIAGWAMLCAHADSKRL